MTRLALPSESFLVADDVELQWLVPLASLVVAPAVPFIEPPGMRSFGGLEASEVAGAGAHRVLRLLQQDAAYALPPARGIDEHGAQVRNAWWVVLSVGIFELLPRGPWGLWR